MTAYLSQKINVLSFVAIIGVVYLHAYYTESMEWSWIYYIQRGIALAANVCVPFFFVVSGYLFFLRKDSLEAIFDGMRKRMRTLLIPYLIWCIIFILIIGVLSNFIHLQTDGFSLIESGEYVQFLKYVFWTPAAFHLWYVRDLLIIVLFSPFLYWGMKFNPVVFLLAISIVFGYCINIPIANWSLVWFSIGACFARLNREPFGKINNIIGLLCLGVFISAVIIELLYRIPLTTRKTIALPILFMGIIGIWKAYDILIPENMIIPSFFGYTFAIYCAHVPLLNIYKKLFFPIMGSGPIACMTGWTLSPILTILTVIAICKIFKNISPNLYGIVFGGR